VCLLCVSLMCVFDVCLLRLLCVCCGSLVCLSYVCL